MEIILRIFLESQGSRLYSQLGVHRDMNKYDKCYKDSTILVLDVRLYFFRHFGFGSFYRLGSNGQWTMDNGQLTTIAILNHLWQCLKTAILALTGFQAAHLLQLI